ncbi:HAD hydrolase, family IA, variant 3 [Oesophagostomum dentatum]|uniref:HAD hydrolase, family IA, variant 3 n=1 Tax=Oesophagostomum dentatum TaxID=61180 RepID=A0A0B1T005_OESDE|nr:HAD hydrolase, family IA, variant 3 [Oesophagostomum dentatum]
MGGVLIPSPLNLYNDLEISKRCDAKTLFSVLLKPPILEHFEAFERGEITAEEFDEILTNFYNKRNGHTEKCIPLFTSITKALADIELISEMVDLIKDLRSAGCKVALLTNNFYADRARKAPTVPKGIEKYFDVVVESCRVGMRKPEPRIYTHICGLLKVQPEECMFLDDLGVNLKSARAMGITTIKVTSADKAVKEVREALKDQYELPSNPRD